MELNITNMNKASVMGASMAPQPAYMAPSYGYSAPSYGYACQEPCNNDSFVLIVVLFILLIIVGACFFPKC
ncbi:YjcZ family sporulation protein [Ferdinandcohnia sp. Marseille-Q9671]